MDLLDNFGEEEVFAPGEVIIREGDVSRDIYIITEGIVEVLLAGDGRDHILGEIHAPELLGEISFLDGSPRTATARAKTAVKVFVLGYEKVKGELDALPVLIKLLIKSFTHRVMSSNHKVKDLEKEVAELRAALLRRG